MTNFSIAGRYLGDKSDFLALSFGTPENPISSSEYYDMIEQSKKDNNGLSQFSGYVYFEKNEFREGGIYHYQGSDIQGEVKGHKINIGVGYRDKSMNSIKVTQDISGNYIESEKTFILDLNIFSPDTGNIKKYFKLPFLPAELQKKFIRAIFLGITASINSNNGKISEKEIREIINNIYILQIKDRLINAFPIEEVKDGFIKKLLGLLKN